MRIVIGTGRTGNSRLSAEGERSDRVSGVLVEVKVVLPRRSGVVLNLRARENRGQPILWSIRKHVREQ
jgi:hypothetical protein